jgi:hypothetical protein
MDEKAIIGRVENIDFSDYGVKDIKAKIDTGAFCSSVWASNINEGPAGLSFTLFDPTFAQFTGQKIVRPAGEYAEVEITNSFGQTERRYIVKLTVKLKGKIIEADFTLANRSLLLMPVLVGRELLAANNFIVDVTKGNPLTKKQTQKQRELINARKGEL